MLILSRKLNESIVINGRIVVKVLRIDKDTVKLGVQAPTDIPVHREEVHQAILKGQPVGPRDPNGPLGASTGDPHSDVGSGNPETR